VKELLCIVIFDKATQKKHIKEASKLDKDGGDKSNNLSIKLNKNTEKEKARKGFPVKSFCLRRDASPFIV
jgi:hypothetical protein